MKFYKTYNEKKQQCLLCNHYCILKEGQTGMCGVNKNVDGKVECLVYGYPAVVHVDPVEKKPLFQFLPNTKILSIGSVGCNFACPFCQNHGISQEHNINKSQYLSPEDIVNIAIAKGCESIAYTYNEPTIFYPYARDISILAHERGLKTVYVSNGYESDEVIKDMPGIIDAINIDLKSFDKKYYKRVLRGDLPVQLENIKKFHKSDIWVEITTLIIPTKNDSDEELTKIAEFIASVDTKIPWHISAFHPDYKQMDLDFTPLDTLERAYKIGKKAGIKQIYMGNLGQSNPTNCLSCGFEVISRTTYDTTKDLRKNGDTCPMCNEKLNGIFKSIRESSVAGSFYPNNCYEVTHHITQFNKFLENSDFIPKLEFKPKAIIVPHAGYIYSGFTANAAYSLLETLSPKRVLVIGPSHRVAFKGASVIPFDEFQTPCRNIQIDKEYSNELIKEFDFIDFNEDAHHEHSTETQMPFIHYYLPNAKVVEIVYGDISYEEISKIVSKALADHEDTFVVISTDFSHFHDLKTANHLDGIGLEAIKKLDLDIWNSGTEACGRIGVKALLKSSNEFSFKSRVLDYRTSFETTKDDQSVVGYVSAVIG